MEVSTVSAMAGKAARSKRKRLTNSAAMCCESAALPPLPHNNSLFSLAEALHQAPGHLPDDRRALFDGLFHDPGMNLQFLIKCSQDSSLSTFLIWYPAATSSFVRRR